MSVVINGEISSLENYMLKGIKDCQSEHIKFKNISFRCKTIEDADGNVFTKSPEREKGCWYKPTGMMPPEYAGVYRCSECSEIAMRDWKHHKQILTKFCPNCGAKMRGDER